MTKLGTFFQEDLHGEVEDLPILVEGLPFHIFSVLNVVDCLRLGVFDTDKLVGRFLFRIPLHPIAPDINLEVYATDLFKDKVEQNKLSGIEFIKPPQISAEMIALIQSRRSVWPAKAKPPRRVEPGGAVFALTAA